MMTRWRDPVERNALSPLPDLHPLVGQMLAQRGMSTPEAVRSFINPDAYAPSPASALPGMDAAVDRIAAAIRTKEPICIWGDFDVDGQTSTTVLVQALSALGADVSWHIPVRARENRRHQHRTPGAGHRGRRKTDRHLRHGHHRPRSRSICPLTRRGYGHHRPPRPSPSAS